MQKLKKFLSVMAMTGLLGFSAAPSKSQAGIILLPVGVGIYFLIIGAIYDDPGYILLDQDSQSQIKDTLSKKFPQLDDEEALTELAQLIDDKAKSATPDAEGKIKINLDETEVENILAPTGLLETDPKLVDSLIAELS